MHRTRRVTLERRQGVAIPPNIDRQSCCECSVSAIEISGQPGLSGRLPLCLRPATDGRSQPLHHASARLYQPQVGARPWHGVSLVIDDVQFQRVLRQVVSRQLVRVAVELRVRLLHSRVGAQSGISDLFAPGGPFIHPGADERTKLFAAQFGRLQATIATDAAP